MVKKSAFVGEKIFNIFKMHGTTIKNNYEIIVLLFIGIFLFYNIVLCEHRLTHNVKVILKL
jgi:hypothetical protein